MDLRSLAEEAPEGQMREPARDKVGHCLQAAVHLEP